jgi:2-hydroxychromene-2-carboxylate isomerase
VTAQVEYCFDFGSPTAYLAWARLPAIAERTGADLVCRPMLLGGLFKLTDNVSPVANKAKGAYLLRDIERCAERHGVAYRMNPHFPINTLALMRGAIAADMDGILSEYMAAVFPAIWANGLDMADPGVVSRVLTEAGIDVERIFARIQDDDVKQALIANTSEAAERGAFGAPTMFVGDEMFFGQDRLDFVEEALGR